MKRAGIFLTFFLIVTFSRAQEDVEIAEIDNSIEYPCHEYISVVVTDSEGRNDTEIECVLRNVKINSMNRNQFKLQLNKTKIALMKNWEPDIFDANDHQKDFILQAKFERSQIRIFPEKLFVQAPKLKFLDISNIGVKFFYPKTFVNALSLEELFADGNELKKIDGYLFMNTTNLKVLDLANNYITKVDKEAFKGLENLVKLSLEDNSISSLQDEVFIPLKSLVEIFLGNNKLTIIPSSLFSNFHPKLAKIFLNNNRISHISYYAFNNLPKLQYLMLKGNGCVNRDFVNNRISGNSHVSLELKGCIRAFNKILNEDKEVMDEVRKDLDKREEILKKILADDKKCFSEE